jgi:hypothetical protein
MVKVNEVRGEGILSDGMNICCLNVCDQKRVGE